MTDTTASYRCKVSGGNSRALLRLGCHRFNVDVVEMSRDSFCVRVPSKIANQVAVGSKSKLFYQEMLWSVLCTQKWISDSQHVDLEFKQLAELTPLKVPKGPIGATTKGTRAIQSDNSLAIAFGVALVIAVLIMPAWGGQWGTSDALCTAVQSTWSALGQLITNSR
jgi:hypothetical protein